MNFYERYMQGGDGQAIYEEIYSLGETALEGPYFEDIQKVMTETFERVVFNLDVIFKALNEINYAFKTEFNLNSDKPLIKPLKNTDKLLVDLDTVVAKFGHVPYSLKLFYKIVGACDFTWDYNNEPEIIWKYADPIQIMSLDDLVEYVDNDDWAENLNDVLEYDEDERPCLELAADYYHKDNVSGGPAYSIELTKEPSIDSLFLNEPNETTFIDYLRICMENCAFPGMAGKDENGYKAFFVKLKPLLKRI